MKRKLNPVPAAKRTEEKIKGTNKKYVQLIPEEAQKLSNSKYTLKTFNQ